MKFLSPAPVMIALSLAAGVGYSLGRLGKPTLPPMGSAASLPHSGSLTGNGVKNRKSDRRPASTLGPGLEQLVSPESLADQVIGETTFKSLAEPDPNRRLAAVGILLESMTAANAESIREAFVQITKRTGRRHHNEWGMMMEQYGKVMGAAGWKELKESNTGDRASAMEGWASADPAAALAALDKNDNHYLQLRSAMLSGITRKDPEMGFRLVLEDADGYDSGGLIDSAIQTLGMDGATAALQRVMDEAGEKAAETPGVALLFHGLAESMFHQKWTSGESEKMLTWLETQKGQPFLHDSTIHHGAKDAVLQGKLDVALDWLDRMSEGRETNPIGISGLVQGLSANPTMLASMDAATLDRIVSMAPHSTYLTQRLALALEASSPAHAERLRALPPAPRNPTRFDPEE